MSKRIGGTDQFVPGVIYELRWHYNNEWFPFYVGETIDPAQRLSTHKSAGKNATDASTLVYRFIKNDLDANGIEWDMFTVADYGHEGPEELEDEHIMALLHDGVKLKNEKKGNANWLSNRMQQAEDMRSRGIRSYRQYKLVLSQEAHERQVQAKHEEWLKQQAAEQLEQEETAQREYFKGIINKLDQELHIRRAEKEKKQQEKILKELRRQREIEEARAIQRAEWELEQQRLQKLEEQKLTDATNNILEKIGLSKIQQQEEINLGHLFEVKK